MSENQGPEIRPVPFAAGMLLGAVVGFFIWIATDTFVLFPAFISLGFVLGLVFSRRRTPPGG